MRRLVYAPKVHAFVRTEDPKNPVVNLTDYIVRGNVHRRTNAVSSAEIELRNPAKMFTRPGNPLLRPMDPITVYLTRIKNRPIQVFTGYLDTTPYLQLFPGTVTLSASCTLKRLLHTYWDPSLPYVFDGFLREYGWNLNPKTGQMFSESLYDGPTLDRNNRSLNDGSFGSLLYATLKHIGQWDSDDIYIEKLPDGKDGSADIVEKVTAIYNTISEDNGAVQDNIKGLFKGLLGSGSLGSGGGPLGDAPDVGADGTYTVEELVQLAEAMGLRGEPAAIAGAIAMAESSGDPTAKNGIPCVGVWQINASVHKTYTEQELEDPIKNGKEMIRISSNGTNWDPWTTYTGADTPGNEKTYLRFLDAARKALSSGGDEPDATQWRERSDGRKNEQDTSSRRQTGAAPRAPEGSHTAPVSDDENSTTRWDAILAEANRMAKKHEPYAFGAGHASPVPKDGPWDCSSAVSSLLQAAGYDIATFATPSAPSVLHPGEGNRITFWNNANPGRGGHIYAVIDGKRWGAESSQNTGWLSGDGPAKAGYKAFTVPGGEDSLDEPADVPADADTSVPGGSDAGGSGGATGDAGGNTNASAFAAYLNLPGVLDTAEAIGLAGQKSLLNDQPLFPFVQQLSQGSLRNFMSMPNGKFFAFFPDHFGGFSHRTPYWLIDDIEILDGKIDLTDEFLATHVYIIGDINFDQTIDMLDRLQSGGVMDLESAFKSGFITMPDEAIGPTSGDTGGLGVEKKMSRTNVLKFLQKYGARPYKEELPMIRSPFFEAFLAYQKFMELWAKQFATKFEFTFMPELYPGGIVGLWEHGVQCYVEEVIHSFDYESGFTTQAILSSPAAMDGNSLPNISAGMVREGDVARLPAGTTKTK